LKNHTNISLEFIIPVTKKGKTYEVIGSDAAETFAAEDYQLLYITIDINAVLKTIITIQKNQNLNR